MLKPAAWLCFLGTATSFYCENCRGAVTPFCAMSCQCGICTGHDGPEDLTEEDYGNYQCQRCWGKMTPWCGRWCWCSECEKNDLAEALMASANTQTWTYTLGFAMCTAVATSMVLLYMVCWERRGSSLRSPLLSSNQNEAVQEGEAEPTLE